jgi:hypothetical protein
MQKDKTELEVTRMTKENIQYLDVFFAVCKRYMDKLCTAMCRAFLLPQRR